MGTTLLLVEDHPQLREILHVQLERRGYLVFSAENASAAMRLLDEIDSIQAVITDFHMPDMDGLELARRIRRSAKFGQLPIIVTSADRQLDLLDRAARLDVRAWIDTPVDVVTLEEVLRSLFTSPMGIAGCSGAPSR